MTRMPPVFSARPDEARTNIAASWAESTSSPAHWAKLLVGPAAVSLADGKKLSISCDNVPGLICFPTQSRHRLSRHPSKRSNFSAHPPNCATNSRKTQNIFAPALTERGLTIKPGVHPIVPIMIGDAAKSQKFAARMLEKGVYVIGFFYPVVPHGTARVRTQVSAAHSRQDLEFAVKAFAEVNEELHDSSILSGAESKDPPVKPFDHATSC